MSWLIMSCEEDKAKDSGDKLPQAIEENNSQSAAKSTEDSIVKSTDEQDDNKNTKQTASENPNTKNSNIETAPDIDDHLQGQINTKYNPDNLNMSFDEKRDNSHIKLFPLLFNEEKSHYYIQFLVTVNKKNIEYFEDLISDKEATIYVTKHKGLFKYAISRYETYEEAKAKVDSIQKKHNLEDIQVAFYGEAF